MKPHLVGSACHRVQLALDEALSEGTLDLLPELAAHAAKCPRCGPEVNDTAALLGRLRSAASGIDLGRVPQVVDYIMAQTAAREVPVPQAAPMTKPTRRIQARWVLAQVAAVAAVILLAVGALTFTALKVNELVSGVKPSEVLQKIVAPFNDSSKAQVRPAK